MFQIGGRGNVLYEDLMRELEQIEHQLLMENSSLAMDLMVLEAKIRDRFKTLDAMTSSDDLMGASDIFQDDLSMEEVKGLIPKDLPVSSLFETVKKRHKRRRNIEAVGMVALLAGLTAIGVFGLASILQTVLSWLA